MSRLLLMCTALALGGAVMAAPVPRPEQLAPEERTAVATGLKIVRAGRADPQRLAKLDGLLAGQPGPTKARGMLQMMRAPLLQDAKRYDEAKLAVRESIQLLPEYSAPLLTGMEVLLYADEAGEAADLFLRASRIDPRTAAQVRSYEVNGLMGRLQLRGDDTRIETLVERLVAIGWMGDDLASRSGVVAQAIRGRLKKGDIAGARGLVPQMLHPAHHYGLLMEKAAEPIWPDIAAFAGPTLEKQWPVYLREARQRFEAQPSSATAGDYLGALLSAGKDQEAATVLLPFYLSPELSRENDSTLQRSAALASLLARLGRWDEQADMYAKFNAIWPLGSSTNALNLTGNQARWLLMQGDHVRSLAMTEAWLAEARKSGGEVNADAVAGMIQHKACALHVAGRRDEARAAAALGTNGLRVSPHGLASMYLCLEDKESAKAALVRALGDGRHSTVLPLLQPDPEAPVRTQLGLKLRTAWEELRRDPDLLRAAGDKGRILPFALGEGAPAVY